MQVLELIFTQSSTDVQFDHCHYMATTNVKFGICNVLAMALGADNSTVNTTAIRIAEL
jgi:hypothetical protein